MPRCRKASTTTAARRRIRLNSVAVIWGTAASSSRRPGRGPMAAVRDYAGLAARSGHTAAGEDSLPGDEKGPAPPLNHAGPCKDLPVTGSDLPPLVARLTHVVRATSSGAPPADSPGPLVALLRREYGTHARTGTHRVTATPHRVYTSSHGMEQPQRSHGMRMPS